MFKKQKLNMAQLSKTEANRLYKFTGAPDEFSQRLICHANTHISLLATAHVRILGLFGVIKPKPNPAVKLANSPTLSNASRSV